MTDYEIDPIPKLPQQIIDAVNNKNLAIFIGAGVSRIIGCAGWKDLANNLIESCYSHSFINFEEKTTLDDYDPKKTITICHHILKQNELETEFFEIIKEALKPNAELESSYKIYEELYGLRGLFITTNVDDRFLNRFYSIACKKEDFKLKEDESKIDSSRLYHIHGSILEPDTLVFTVPQYLEKYNDKWFQIFMRELFSNYVILFVGYGLEEFEILDYLITKFDTNKGQEINHFILRPYNKKENRILEFDQSYYSTLGIKVLPYQKDINGYSQLYEVLKLWNSEINQISAYLYSSFQDIDEVVANFNETSAYRIFQIIRNDEPQENYFFETLASCSNPFPWLEPLRERGYLEPMKNPSLKKVFYRDKCYFEVKYWNVLGYLKNLATKNVSSLNLEVAKILSQIIDSIFEYRNPDGTRILNYRTDSILINVVFKLPTEMIEEKHIGYIENALEINKQFITSITSQIAKVAFPFLILNRKKDLLLKLLNVLFNYEKTDNFYKYSSLVEDHWINEAIFEFRTEIAELCGMAAAEMVLHKIEEIVSEDDTQFRTASITTIENSDQNLIEEDYAYQFVSFIRDIFEATDPEVLRPVILDLLSKSHPIFRRIAIHTINYHYSFLHKIFWGLDFNPIDDYSLKHEIYELLSKNCLSFSRNQLTMIINWIESANCHADDRQLSYRDKYLAYNKKCWLFSVLNTNDPYIVSLYLQYDEINPKKVSYPGDIIHIERFEGNVSPINESELLAKSNDEIVEYLNEFREKLGIRAPSKEGLAETLQKCVSIKPEKFSDDMSLYLRVPEIYQYYIFWGLTEACKNKIKFSWDNVLNFISRLLESTDFWNGKRVENESDNRDCIISQISDLIDEGLLKDHILETGLFSLAENILLILARNTRSSLNNKGDLTTSVLNSSKGKIFSALMDYSIQFSQLNDKSQKKWKESIKSEFNNRLNRDLEPSIEFSYILGKYISYFYYLDEDWTRENINKLFLIDQDKHWEAAFTGYLYYCSGIDKRIYCLLRENGHYKKGVQTKFEDRDINEKLVQHICIGYIEGWEKLEDDKSLISLFLKNPDVEQISEIIRYLEKWKDELAEKIGSKIKPLWKRLYEILSSDEENADYQVIASSLFSWISLIDYIDDETFEWLKFSARNLDSTHYFSEDLVVHAQKTPLEVGKIYLEMLKHGKYPYYQEEETQEIVRILYEKDQKSIANRICICFESKGYRFLREIYQKYNPSK